MFFISVRNNQRMGGKIYVKREKNTKSNICVTSEIYFILRLHAENGTT